MRKAVFFTVLLFIGSHVHAQLLSVEDYIKAYKDIAIREMKRMGIPASITLAQGILETENGNSDLVKKSNNHFGIKCKSSWNGSSVSHDDDANGECFRKYNTAEESFRDHSNFLRGSDRYAPLFKLSATDYKGWAYGLKKAGYATNPSYPEILIKNIEQYNLQQYTLMAAGEVPVFDGSKYPDDEKPEHSSTNEPLQGDDAASFTSYTDASGKTAFNGVKAINVTRGTSLLAIATKYNIGLSRLMEFNDLKDDGIMKEDCIIFLEKKPVRGTKDFCIIQKECSINSIAQSYAIQLSSLLEYNNMNEGVIIKPGTKILLRPSIEIKDNSLYVASKTKLHEVQPKEGLFSISRKYNVSVQELRDWNSLSSDELKIGQQLIISK